MNADLLLAHYERIADAPDAVPRLRRFVLNLAVRGKLVPQDPQDEPASELLERIAAQKAWLVKGHDSLPIPVGWTWTTLGTVANIVMGQSPPGDTYNKSGMGVPLINGPVEFSAGPFGKTTVNQYTTAPTNFCEEGDLLICVRGSTTGRTNVAGFRACIGRGVAAIQSQFGDAFIRLFIWSNRDAIIEMGRGIAFPSVSRKQIEDLPLPLPPLAEQHRIVAKVDELMALCDRLEAARVEREATRDRLTAASLARLNAPDPESFHDDARFALDALPVLTTRPDQITQLRQTILNLAVRGKLVPQDPQDEPASELLERIAAQKAWLVKGHDSLPIPVGWTWTTLGTVANIVMGQSPPGDTYNKSGMGVPLINGPVEFSAGPFGKTTVNQYTTAPTNFCEEGDLLICVRGSTTGRTNVAGFRACIGRGVAAIQSQFGDAFIRLFIWSNRDAIIEMGRGIAFPSVSRKQIEDLPLPLPPFAEQHRIVAKVDELMALCDRLEASLVTGDDTRRRLLDALLAEALASGESILPEEPERAVRREVGHEHILESSPVDVCMDEADHDRSIHRQQGTKPWRRIRRIP